MQPAVFISCYEYNKAKKIVKSLLVIFLYFSLFQQFKSILSLMLLCICRYFLRPESRSMHQNWLKKLHLSTLKNQDQNFDVTFSVILGTVLWVISFHAEVVFGLGKGYFIQICSRTLWMTYVSIIWKFTQSSSDSSCFSGIFHIPRCTTIGPFLATRGRQIWEKVLHHGTWSKPWSKSKTKNFRPLARFEEIVALSVCHAEIQRFQKISRNITKTMAISL